nr:hypothetical protein [Tanacetum cinerariifolium]
MSTIKFVETYNLVAFLKKLAETEGFKQIVDFLNANPIRCTLIVNPTIYTSCIQQFWDSAKVKAVNEDVYMRALIDGKKIIVTEASIRCDLQLQNVEGGVNFFLFPRFVQVFVNHQLGDISHHRKIFSTPSLTKKVFANMNRGGKGYSGIITPLFETMMVQALEGVSEEESQEAKKEKKVKDFSFKKIMEDWFTARAEPSEDKESLGDQEDASKHGRMIDQDEEIALVDETQGRMNEEEMFRVNDLDVTTSGKVVTTVEDVKVTTAATTPQISKDELTLAQTLIKIKAAKPKAKGVIVQEPSEFRTTSSSQLPQAKDKEIVEERSKKTQAEVTEGSSKRAGDELEQESANKQKLKKEDDSAELKRCLKIVPEDDDDVTIQATPLSLKSLTIVDYKI